MGAAIDRVWATARKLTDYPQFMEQVINVEAVVLPNIEQATAWTVLFNGNELQWIEADEYDDAQHRMSFRQIDGDLAEWCGFFEAKEIGGRLLCRYQVTFDLGVPALAHMLHPLGERAIRDNCEQMLREIEVRSQSACADA